MDLLSFPKFMTATDAGARAVPAGYAAVGIHPSSDVDSCKIGGRVLTVGALIPLDGQGAPIETFRERPGDLGVVTVPMARVPNTLALQLYEKCDPLTPPGPRAPTIIGAALAAASLSAVVGTANNLIRLPFWNRRQARITFQRSTAVADLSVLVVGVNWHQLGQTGSHGFFVENTTATWWNGAGAAPTCQAYQTTLGWGGAGDLEARTVYVGGEGDACEGFDELHVFVFGAAGGDVYMTAEAWGER